MKTKRAQLAERVVEGVEDGEEEDAGRGDRGRDVAEDVDLRPARPLRPVVQVHRHAAGLQRGPHRPPHVDHLALLAPPLLVAERRQPALHLGDGAVDGGEVLGRAGRQGAVELGQRARGRQRLGPLDQVAFEFAAQVALEAGQLVAVERRPLLAALGRRLGAGAEPEAAADPLHVDADHAGALLAAEGGDRQPCQVAQRVLVAALPSRRGSVRGARRCRAGRLRPPPGRCPSRSPPGRARRSPARRRSPRRPGRSSGRRAARRRGGRPGTWRSSPPASRGSRSVRSRGRVGAPRRRRGSPRSRPRRPRRAAPRRSRAAAARTPAVRGPPWDRRAKQGSRHR